MCDFSAVIRFSILKKIHDKKGRVKIEDVLSDLSMSDRYNAYVALNRTPIRQYIRNRIEHEDINVAKDGGLTLSASGEEYYNFFNGAIEQSSHRDYWRKRVYA